MPLSLCFAHDEFYSTDDLHPCVLIRRGQFFTVSLTLPTQFFKINDEELAFGGALALAEAAVSKAATKDFA